VVTIVFQALRLPVVLGYVLAGLVIGPHVSVPLVADVELVKVLSELGVSLLVFTIGLELPMSAIARVGVPGALIALFEVGLVVAVGTAVATLVGFGAVPAVFVGVCVGISSTMLVAKSFEELGWKGGFTEIVFAILVFEDLIAIVLLAVLTAVAGGSAVGPGELGGLLVRLGGFLVLMLGGGLLVVPRTVRWVAKRARRETLAITALLVCFGASALAASAGYSVALGAFIGGVLIAESGQGLVVLGLVQVLRDMFAMVFFVSIGMSIDPAVLVREGPRIAALAAVVLACKPAGVSLGVFLGGYGVRPAVRAGLSMAQIGEFSFVLASVLGDPHVIALAVGVACVTTFVSPLLVKRSASLAERVAGGLHGSVGTFVSFYESWLEGLRARPGTWWRRQRRNLKIVAFDASVIVVVVIAGATWGRRELMGLGVVGRAGRAVQIAVVAVVAAPFAYGLLRRIALIARQVAAEVIPSAEGVDLGRAPRRALALTFELGLAMAVLMPIVAIVQAFVPASFAVLLVVVLGIALAMRRSIADFQGHVRASGELIAEMMVEGAFTPDVLPGFGDTERVTIGSGVAGQTLRELDLRARTGATVLAIVRGQRGIAPPPPGEPLEAGDVLALAGSDEAVAAAREILQAAAAGSPSSSNPAQVSR
jgi:CPA2 family monovalent cation:H+ antiporter-2